MHPRAQNSHVADGIQHLFNLLAIGIGHRNPFAIVIVAAVLALALRVVGVLGPSRRPPVGRGRRPRPVRYYAPPRPPVPRPPRMPVPARIPRPPGGVITARPALPAPQRTQPAPARMPDPSPDLAPADLGAVVCRHQDGIARVTDSTETVLRYTCANFRCDAVWPPDTRFPGGTVIF